MKVAFFRVVNAMTDVLLWFIIAALFVCTALLRTAKTAPFLRFSQLWVGLSIMLFAVFDLRHPLWLKWVIIAVAAGGFVAVSVVRTEAGQRTKSCEVD